MSKVGGALPSWYWPVGIPRRVPVVQQPLGRVLRQRLTTGAGKPAVVRGDVNSISVGARTNVQDGSVLHVTHDGPYSPGGRELIIGADVTIGHRAILHACTIGDASLVGMGAIILDDVVTEDFVIIGAGSIVPPGKRLEGGYLWLGNPVRRVRPLTLPEREQFEYSALHYVRLKDRYLAG